MKDKILELKKKCYECRACPLGNRLVAGLDPHVFADGRAKVGVIMCVAEAPGAKEVEQKRTLCGRSGKFYEEEILGVAGIKRREVWTTNTCLCRPNEKNRNPLLSEVEICINHHLDAQVCLLEPKMIVVMGNIPLYGVCEKSGITKERGKIQPSRKWSNGKTYPVYPICHPSFCIRGNGRKEMKEDAERIGRIFRGEESI